MNYQALTIFGAAKCTLECEYCYIRKTDDIKKIDLQVMKWLENPVLPKSFNSDEVRTLSIWGGEPTLHLDIICKNLKKYQKLFPKLRGFSTSSNMTYSKHFDVFAKMLSDNNYSLELQISDDSGLFNKKNRGVESKVIQKNTLRFIESLVKYNCNFSYHFKSTTSIENFELLVEHDDILMKYFDYFEDFAGKIKDIIGSKKFNKMVTSATVVCPGAYTKDQGLLFFRYLDKTLRFIKNDKFKHYKNTEVVLNYPERWVRNLPRFIDFVNMQRTFTCSAGDSNILVDTLGNIHACHRTLFFAYEDHLNSLRRLDQVPNDDVEYLKTGLIDVFKKYQEYDYEKLRLHMRSMHDNYKQKISTTIAMIIELSLSGQILEKYSDRQFAEVFALFLHSCSGCPIENFFVTSSWHLYPLSSIRLYGNGAFEIIHDVAYNILVKSKGKWND